MCYVEVMRNGTTATKVKNGSIALPTELRNAWKDAEVFVRSSDDTIIVKRIRKAPFWTTWEKLRVGGKKINRKDVNDAIQWTRGRSR